MTGISLGLWVIRKWKRKQEAKAKGERRKEKARKLGLGLGKGRNLRGNGSRAGGEFPARDSVLRDRDNE